MEGIRAGGIEEVEEGMRAHMGGGGAVQEEVCGAMCNLAANIDNKVFQQQLGHARTDLQQQLGCAGTDHLHQQLGRAGTYHLQQQLEHIV